MSPSNRQFFSSQRDFMKRPLWAVQQGFDNDVEIILVPLSQGYKRRTYCGACKAAQEDKRDDCARGGVLFWFFIWIASLL